MNRTLDRKLTALGLASWSGTVRPRRLRVTEELLEWHECGAKRGCDCGCELCERPTCRQCAPSEQAAIDALWVRHKELRRRELLLARLDRNGKATGW